MRPTPRVFVALVFGVLIGATPLLGWLLTWLVVSVTLALLFGTAFVLARDGPRSGPRLLVASTRALLRARPCEATGTIRVLDAQVTRARRGWLLALALLGLSVTGMAALAWCARHAQRLLALCSPAWQCVRERLTRVRRIVGVHPARA